MINKKNENVNQNFKNFFLLLTLCHWYKLSCEQMIKIINVGFQLVNV